MGQDISRVLEGWDFDPHELNVRIITGLDGKSKIQMRIDLGLLQMCIDGRPDGQRPHSCDSVLDHYMKEAKEYGQGYSLSTEAMEDLFREGLQFYHRYLCLFHLGEYELVVRDTDRNLGMFRFVLDHARKRRDQWRFDQYRPYVLMMNTRAKAMLSLENQKPARAVKDIESGCTRIREFLDHYGRSTEECFELDFLDRWAEELRQSGKKGDPEKAAAPEQTPPPVVEPAPRDRDNDLISLRKVLDQLIDREEYESAAVVRDQIKRIEQGQRDNV
ncbi:UvrB/UvrC motif-containing protein [bacterium]|nr:UvrB/UvrC motif-containing protein [bacterium]